MSDINPEPIELVSVKAERDRALDKIVELHDKVDELNRELGEIRRDLDRARRDREILDGRAGEALEAIRGMNERTDHHYLLECIERILAPAGSGR